MSLPIHEQDSIIAKRTISKQKLSKMHLLIKSSKILLAAAPVMLSMVLLSSSVYAAKVPAGCPGGPKGPKAPGVACPADNGGNGKDAQPNGTFKTGDNKTHHDVCGSGSDAVPVSINIGCNGKGNPITDMVFAIIRILSDGVGLVVIGSIIVGGIQYTASRGDPQSTAMAVNRIRSSVFALMIFIFGYAILNFIIPVGFFNQ